MIEKIINTLIVLFGQEVRIIKITKLSIDFTFCQKKLRVICKSLNVLELTHLNNTQKTNFSEYIEREIKDCVNSDIYSDTKEIWKDVIGYEGLYKVSNLGNIKSMNYNRTGDIKNLSFGTDRCGYSFVHLYKENKSKIFRVHRLVAEAFIPNDNKKLTLINHKDENKLNNRVENLEWCDSKYNINYSKDKNKGINSKKIIQMNMNEVVVQEWDSISEAANSLCYSKSSISNCCRGKIKSYKNFLWKFL